MRPACKIVAHQRGGGVSLGRVPRWRLVRGGRRVGPGGAEEREKAGGRPRPGAQRCGWWVVPTLTHNAHLSLGGGRGGGRRIPMRHHYQSMAAVAQNGVGRRRGGVCTLMRSRACGIGQRPWRQKRHQGRISSPRAADHHTTKGRGGSRPSPVVAVVASLGSKTTTAALRGPVVEIRRRPCSFGALPPRDYAHPTASVGSLVVCAHVCWTALRAGCAALDVPSAVLAGGERASIWKARRLRDAPSRSPI